MNHFEYRDGELWAEDVPLSRIAEAVGTPAYVYASATMERHYRVLEESLKAAIPDTPITICYAMKANGNLAVVKTLGRLGAGADVVSVGELERAIAAGIPGERIVFSGVGKTVPEMTAALDRGVLQFNVESEPELAALSALAEARGQVAPIALRINPDVDARTHAKISTGKAENKFGIPLPRARAVYDRAAASPGLRIVGVDVHIGSQLTDLQPFELAFQRLVGLAEELRSAGHDIRRIDFGGGLGIPYSDDAVPPLPRDYAAMVGRVAGGRGFELVFEPGRLIVGNAGVLLSRVIYLKQGTSRTFVVLDAAMNDLMRPALYDSAHDARPVREPAPDATPRPVDLVGPVCETGDTFARNFDMPPLKAGDIVVLHSAGAYGAVMSSSYNSRPLVPEVLVRGDRFAVVRPRPSHAEMLAMERLPDWLEDDASSRSGSRRGAA